MYTIEFGAADSLFAVLIALEVPRLPLRAHMASWPGIWIRRVRLVDTVASITLGTFQDVLDTAWCGRFAARLVWAASGCDQ